LEGFPVIPVPARFLQAPQEWGAVKRVVRGRATLFHSPSFASFPGLGVPYVVTVHDLNHLQYGGWLKAAYYHLILKPFLRKARAVTAVSQFSARELAQWMDGGQTPIPVIENAVDPLFTRPPPEVAIRARVATRGLEPGGYLACITNGKPHKRLEFLLQVFARYRAAGGTLPLVTNVAGSPQDGVVRLGGLPGEQLPEWMSGACAVFFPSAYEGFGLPPLEAALLGTPVVVSQIDPHQEAFRFFAAEEVTWCPVDDFPAWQAAMERAERRELPKPGVEHARKTAEALSPEVLARKTDTLYTQQLARILRGNL
jgi:glycosyltransferase involved in cell wall biosynthesis